ncbi:hypothetical protein [Agromyces badenianii]|uniref:hypothetical protein n=1 Tax=Agromyces badenianii TaxID=2080742 RepID=UPI000D599D9F|nr:hypothetical protein [Agromyces badenianii]PWC04218.1 hypothetical protein DCE94_08665 [Agromyces badenianii]
MSDDLVRINFELPKNQRQALKAYAARQGTTITALLTEFINSLPLQMEPKRLVHVEVERDGGWWLVRIPELDTVGQAREREDVEQVAAEIAGLWLDMPAADLEVRFIV